MTYATKKKADIQSAALAEEWLGTTQKPDPVCGSHWSGGTLRGNERSKSAFRFALVLTDMDAKWPD